ncbi:sugar porter family MFS transporter [Psychrosphaera sp. 1_MG-2023]|uniref:sugar porter family MFS transporter n=1 Tax=Psychrosphaera sp. 1_MG-2023 TaxID=3062643 RepID=UPI0026E2A44A|nr:sugar porter family MFS transporter [Psychrosphaera sp. 1_MG-2023]MDO6721059.1 sugar porter family MFS transporter [Psychrosphaera sp. 1_MG-2023]
MPISRVMFYTICVSLGGFIFGFDASVISGAIQYIVEEFNLSPIELGFVVSAPTLGATAAILVAGPLADKFGRRNLLRVIALLYLVSAVFSALATSYWMLVIARFVGGLAFCSLMVAPMYIAEISPAAKRGKMVSVNQLNIVIGFSAAYFANYYLFQASQTTSSFTEMIGLQDNIWRWMLGLEIIPAIIWLGLLYLIPKSPRWLLLKNNKDDAKHVLTTLRDKNSVAEIELEIGQIEDSAKEKSTGLLTSLQSLFSSKLRLALSIGLIVGIAQQITGINAIFFYAPSIFEQSGVGTDAAFAQAIFVGLINVVFTVLAMYFIDKLGRKPLLIIGLAGVFVSMTLCSYGFNQATYKLSAIDYQQVVTTHNELPQAQLVDLRNVVDITFESDVVFKQQIKQYLDDNTYNKLQSELLAVSTDMNAGLVLFGILAFVASFAFSLGPVMWVLFSEIFPNHLRGVAISFVSVINSVVSFVVTLVFPIELESLGASMTFLLYGLFALLSLIFVVKLFPETKGKTLEQLEVEFNQG